MKVLQKVERKMRRSSHKMDLAVISRKDLKVLLDFWLAFKPSELSKKKKEVSFISLCSPYF